MSGLVFLLNAIGYFWAFVNLMLLARILAIYKMDRTMLVDHKATLFEMMRDDPAFMAIATLIFPCLFFYMLVKDEE